MAGLKLSYLALVARDVDAARRFLNESMGLRPCNVSVGGRTVPFFGVGRAAIGLFELDDPYLDAPVFPGVHHMGLALEDPDENPSAAAARLGLTIVGTGSDGPGERPYATIAPDATCGIRTRLVTALDVETQPGPVHKIDHLGIATNDLDANRRVFVNQLGCTLESVETDVEIRNITESFVSDKYGAVYHARQPEILGGLHGLFINVGDCELEIMQDYDANLTPLNELGRAAGNTKGDQSAIAKFLARRGPGLAHVAFATSDIDGMMARLTDDGWRVIDTRGRPGGRASRIAFVHPSNFGGGLLMHFVEPRER